MASALAQLQPLVPRLRENYPRQWREKSQFHLFELPRLRTDYMEGDGRRAPIVSLFLMSISAVVLLIACLNLANMIVVQGTTRHREIAIRMAIGGGRLHIIRQLLFEFGLLAVLGGAFGLILAFWGNRVLNAWVDVPHLGVDLAGAFSMSLDLRVLGATLGFCVLATVLFGLRPALRLSRRDIIRGISNFEIRNPNVAEGAMAAPAGSVRGGPDRSVRRARRRGGAVHPQRPARRGTQSGLQPRRQTDRSDRSAFGRLRSCPRHSAL